MDVAAVGLEDGRIVVHNLKFDETIVTFTQDWGPVTAISFRTGKFCFLGQGGKCSLWGQYEEQ